MSARASNVVHLFSGMPRGLPIAAQRPCDLASDRNALIELGQHLRSVKAALTTAAAEFDRAGEAATSIDPLFRCNSLFTQIEALQDGIQQLVGAMTTHQPYA
ncbi:hypothetical protein [Methylobacterium sp. A54F]